MAQVIHLKKEAAASFFYHFFKAVNIIFFDILLSRIMWLTVQTTAKNILCFIL